MPLGQRAKMSGDPVRRNGLPERGGLPENVTGNATGNATGEPTFSGVWLRGKLVVN
jgi:hypothetical protein